MKAKGWSGPRQDTISHPREREKLHAYLRAREEEQQKPEVHVVPNSQIENLLAEIPGTEVRQFFCHQLEKKRAAEQELKLLKNGLKKVPSIDVIWLLKPDKTLQANVLTDRRNARIHEDHRATIQRLLSRLESDNLRYLGLKLDGQDIVTMTGAEALLHDELSALYHLSQSPVASK